MRSHGGMKQGKQTGRLRLNHDRGTIMRILKVEHKGTNPKKAQKVHITLEYVPYIDDTSDRDSKLVEMFRAAIKVVKRKR